MNRLLDNIKLRKLHKQMKKFIKQNKPSTKQFIDYALDSLENTNVDFVFGPIYNKAMEKELINQFEQRMITYNNEGLLVRTYYFSELANDVYICLFSLYEKPIEQHYSNLQIN